MKLSIVSPCFNEELNLLFFFEEIDKLLNKVKKDFNLDLEVIIVDDGSTDSSRDIIKGFAKNNNFIIPVFNPRNYGVYRASYAGLKIASGDIVVPMFPVDLQDPPDVLYDLIAAKINIGSTGVFGRKVDREEGVILSGLRNFFYILLDFISNSSVNRNVGEFGVLDKWVIDECIKRNDYYPYLRGMFSNISSDFRYIDYTWKKRINGKSKHNLLNLYDHAMNAFVSSGAHFFRPLVFIGFLISIISVLFSVLNLGLYIYDRELFSFRGIASIIIMFSFFFGFVLAFLGFLGEYVVAIHSQVRGFDRTINVGSKDE